MQPDATLDITVNGSPRRSSARTLGELLAELKVAELRTAVMVNDAIIRRADRPAHPLRPGDRVEIISMVGGG